jgi:hypothetical protein
MVKVSMQQNNETKNEYKFGAEGSTPTPSGDISNETVTFTEASTRANISTGETLAVICGKIKKFFTDLKTVAFSGSYNDLTDTPRIPIVNNAKLTIKQGGTTKGTFTANANTDVEIDLDAGGGSEYTAGAGIDITNDVISVTNPIVKTDISFDDAVIPCLFQDTTNQGPLTKEDGTNATLADCLDLGASTLNIGAQFLKYINNVHVSGSAKAYDYGTQTQTTLAYDEDILSATTMVSTSDSYGLFDETAQVIGGAITSGSQYITLQIVLGKANGHLYAFVYNGYWGTLSEQSYISACTCTADVEFTQI